MKKIYTTRILAALLILAGFQTAFADNDEITRDLKLGHRNDEVKALQEFLIERGYLSTTATGYFGQATSKAVTRFQKEKKIDAVGRVGVITRKALNSEMRLAKEKKSDNGHTAKNSLDYFGEYNATLPCASCERIEVKIELRKDNTYFMTEKYVKGEGFVSTSTGNFTWKGSKIIVLGTVASGTRPSQYMVEENTLTQLDMNGNKITGVTAPMYVFKKVIKTSLVEDKRWKMIELQGKKIEGTSESHFVVLNKKDGRLEAKAGCNNMGGMYTLVDDYKFKTMGVFSTMMACENMDDEQVFSQVLEMADNISYSENTLSLNKGRMAPLARFELVK